MRAWEVNFDGLAGPTHNHAGLAYGNLASMKNRLRVSNPRAAALQGLKKMKLLADMGLAQAVFPPQERPELEVLRRLGFRGAQTEILAQASRVAPELLAACYSASSMWVANAVTVSPSADTADGRVHLTPANLAAQFHRSLEPPATAALLRAIFKDEEKFVLHPPLPGGAHLGDEGAANHLRLCRAYGEPGIEVFAYGRSFSSRRRPLAYPARQSLEASAAIARLHGLDPEKTVFVRQNPALIEAGVFHHDLVAVGNGPVLLCHQLALVNRRSAMAQLRRKLARHCRAELVLLEASPEQVPVADAVQTYLFNSQLVTLPDWSMCLIAPVECRANPRVREWVEELAVGANPIQSVRYVDLRESMKNGGGPACLRFRVVLTEEEMACLHQGVLLTEPLYGELTAWVGHFYRDRLGWQDLADPQLLEEGRSALDALTQILKLGSVYRFQGANF